MTKSVRPVTVSRGMRSASKCAWHQIMHCIKVCLHCIKVCLAPNYARNKGTPCGVPSSEWILFFVKLFTLNGYCESWQVRWRWCPLQGNCLPQTLRILQSLPQCYLRRYSSE